MGLDLDKCIAKVKQCEWLEEGELQELCGMVKDLLLEEANVQPVYSPVTICGDIHGQFHDLLKLFDTGGDMPETSYIFMGDFVDRGYNSLEVFTLLMLLKARWPTRMVLLRGNHESRQITQVYGFYDECQRKYGNANAWRFCTEVFDFLTLAVRLTYTRTRPLVSLFWRSPAEAFHFLFLFFFQATIDNATFCVHGGLSPDLRTIDRIQTLDRCVEIPHEGPFCDLLWSDPEEIDSWSISPRGAGWLFGSKVTSEFNQTNGLNLICRAHQLVQEGLKYMFEKQNLVTVWSAPNYCYRCGNIAAILTFDENMERSPRFFTETKQNSTMLAPGQPLPCK